MTGPWTAERVAELFSGPRDPIVEERMLRAELAAMNRRHARARAPIVARLAQLTRDNGDTVVTFPGGTPHG